jgi:hypothetical protein
MAKGSEVLSMLIPNGGWAITGDEYDGIQFLECDPITKKEFEAGFAKYEALKAAQETERAEAKTALLARLGITSDEAALLLG